MCFEGSNDALIERLTDKCSIYKKELNPNIKERDILRLKKIEPYLMSGKTIKE
jgi:hypothetical protein